MFSKRNEDFPRKGGWTSVEHFSVDGTLIDAWASMKGFRPKDVPKKPGDSNGWSDFKGQKRSNDTHTSKTDPEAKLLRKSKGSASNLCFGLHASMDNRNGLCVTLDVHQAVSITETSGAIDSPDKPLKVRLQVQDSEADNESPRESSSKDAANAESHRIAPKTPLAGRRTTGEGA